MRISYCTCLMFSTLVLSCSHLLLSSSSNDKQPAKNSLHQQIVKLSSNSLSAYISHNILLMFTVVSFCSACATNRVWLLLANINSVFLHSNIVFPQSFSLLCFSVAILGNIGYYFWNNPFAVRKILKLTSPVEAEMIIITEDRSTPSPYGNFLKVFFVMYIHFSFKKFEIFPNF